jgi:hypothetical protein
MPTPDTSTNRSNSQPPNRQLSQSATNTPEQAKNWLEREGLIPRNGNATFSTLASALTQLVHNVARLPKQAVDGINAIAILITSLEEARITEIIASKVETIIRPTIDRLVESANEVRECAENLCARSIANTNTLEEFREDTHVLHELISSAVVDLAEQAQIATERHPHGNIPETPNTPGDLNAPSHVPSQPPNPSPQSYAAAVRAVLTPGHEEALARAQGRLRQVLIEREILNPSDSAEEGMTEKVLVEKANTAIDLMADAFPGRPHAAKLFVGAQKLARGRILYQMASEEAATWLKREDVQKGFIDHYGTPVKVRNQGYNVIMEYVPISFDPNS